MPGEKKNIFYVSTFPFQKIPYISSFGWMRVKSILLPFALTVIPSLFSSSFLPSFKILTAYTVPLSLLYIEKNTQSFLLQTSFASVR